jgi:hypothetical protein
MRGNEFSSKGNGLKPRGEREILKSLLFID